MDADTSQLAAISAHLRELDGVGAAIAADALAPVLEEAKRTAAAGTTAEGVAWAPTKKDGARALKNAAAAISAVVSGASRAVLTLVLRGPEVFHHSAKGNGKHGTPRRAVLFDPANGVPAKMRDAIATSARKIVGHVMGGSR